MSTTRGPIVHYARVDRWVAALFGGVAVIAFAAGAALLVAGLTFGSIHVGLGVLFGLWLWTLYRIRYEVTSSDLIVRCGPFRSRVPLETILEVFPTRNPLGAPAPSLDRLQITYRKKGW